MALSQYVGKAVPNEGGTVVHVTPHSHWRPGQERTEPCSNCGTVLTLSEKHVLVELETPDTDERVRRYFENERCLGEWLEA
ncbi:hypothetical protein [Haloarchaeobius sp. TZWWS8]|uniref:hypothetical protein n=1 Tax=Haloarchaeobius sp. TZWWS8 TaxID=3446121 RepID=UPI003EB7FBB3